MPARWAADQRAKLGWLATSLTQTGRGLATTLVMRPIAMENSLVSDTARKSSKRCSCTALQMEEDTRRFWLAEAIEACPSGQPVNSQIRSTADCIASAMLFA